MPPKPAVCWDCGRRFRNYRREWADFCFRVCRPLQAERQAELVRQRRDRERLARHMRPALPELNR